MHGLVASPYKSAYVAAKHGLEGLSKTIALEGGGRGVTSTCISPGYVHTALVDAQVADQARTRADQVQTSIKADAGLIADALRGRWDNDYRSASAAAPRNRGGNGGFGRGAGAAQPGPTHPHERAAAAPAGPTPAPGCPSV